MEIAGAVERPGRGGALTRPGRRLLLDRFTALTRTWDEVTDVPAVRRRALALLGRNPLRAADAAQLGAALLVADHLPPGMVLVCLDQRLAAAGEPEDLRVLPQPAS